MKGDAGDRLAGYVIGTLPQRLKKDNDIFSSSFNLLKGESRCKLKLLCKGMEDPLVALVSILHV
jgi:hypothetical protein